MVLEKKTQFSVKWRGLLDVTAVELLSWTCHIEKASFLYFYTSITLIMSWRTLHHNDALTPTIEPVQENINALPDPPVPITLSTFHTKKEISNEYLLNVLIVETSCQFLASRRPTQTRPNESLVFIGFPCLGPLSKASPASKKKQTRSCPALAGCLANRS